MIRPPSATDHHELCDWAELQAISSARKACTIGDIIKYVRPDDSLQDEDDEISSEASRDELIGEETLSVASVRARALARAYPFDVQHDKLIARSGVFGANVAAYEMYLFQLLVCGLIPEEIDSDARHQFEVESMNVLHDFFGGEAYHFGWTRFNVNQGKIQRRIEAFCESTDLRWRPRKPVLVPAQCNDIGIDAIVWKQPGDQRDNAFVAVGQCASGSNWESKLETQAARLLSDCLEATPSGPVVHCFCTPFHIAYDRWRYSAIRLNGLVFDRIRIIAEAHQGGLKHLGRLYSPDSRSWLKRKLRTVVSYGRP